VHPLHHRDTVPLRVPLISLFSPSSCPIHLWLLLPLEPQSSDPIRAPSSTFPRTRATCACILHVLVLTINQGKRIFIKDITHYLAPPDSKPASIAPSLMQVKRGVGTDSSNPLTDIANGSNGSNTNGTVEKSPPYPYATEAESGNPTVVPTDILNKFHFAFLIRHPKHSIPSYWRCTIPPLDAITGFYNFMPSEAGYDEQRRLFDYLRSCGQIGPKLAGQDGEQKSGAVDICVIDADDLLDNPSAILEQFCKSVGIEYSPSMLNWDNEEDHNHAKEAFEKWRGFHEDAIHSTELKPRTHVSRSRRLERTNTDYRHRRRLRRPMSSSTPSGPISMARKLPRSFSRPLQTMSRTTST
jgi:hypothetical protein